MKTIQVNQREKQERRMEEILSNGVKHQVVPEKYILPPDTRPEICASTCERVPIIHLSLRAENQSEVSSQILSAGKEFGFFQVVDHGIPEEIMKDMMEVSQEFFEMPVEDKLIYCSKDPSKIPRLFTSVQFKSNTEDKRFWRDCLRLAYHGAGDDFTHLYPERPSRFRNVVPKFAAEVEGLATRILNLISEGIGLPQDYFAANNLSKGITAMNVNRYPPCPDPSLTLGLPSHCDPNLITLLLQGNVSGLQVLIDGEWVQVDPIPNAFVVNFGHVLEIATNGLLKSVEHRAVTNMTVARTTIATFINPSEDCVIAPARTLVRHQDNPPLYRSFLYADFCRVYISNQGNTEKTMEALMIKN